MEAISQYLDLTERESRETSRPFWQRMESLVLEKCQERTAGERFDSPRLENLHSCPQCPAETVLGQEFAGQRGKETCASILRTVGFLAIMHQSAIIDRLCPLSIFILNMA